MSDNRFGAALSLLGGAAFAIRGHAKNRKKALQDCKEIADACLVLESWPRWEPLIKAAEKVDKVICQKLYQSLYESAVELHGGMHGGAEGIYDDQIRALLSAIPDEKEEGKI